MSQNATNSDDFPKHTNGSNQSAFLSKQVYAETKRAFTRVSCHDVYAFASVATSGNFSRTAESLKEMIQIGVEIEFPNGRRELLVFQPKNLLQADASHREELLENLLNEGSVWIGEYESVFTPAGFPKSWNMLVVPDTESVDAVFAYTKKNLTSYSPSGKLDLAVVFGHMGAFCGAFVVGAGLAMAISTSSILSFLGIALLPLAIVTMVRHLFGERLMEWVTNRIQLPTPHLWTQRMEPSSEELASCTPLSDSEQETLLNSLLGLDGDWTESTVISITEQSKTTELELLTEYGRTITVQYPTPADGTERFTLNTLVREKDVNSVSALEGKQVEVSITQLGQTSDVACDGFHRVRA